MTLNGSGGELLRNFWWEPAWPFPEIRRGYRLEGLVKRYGGTRFPDMKMFKNKLNLNEHFRGIFNRTTVNSKICAGEKISLIYLHQRMQRWQGSIASATNRVWNNASPLLGNEFLDAVFSIHPSLIKKMKVSRHLFTKYNEKLALIETASRIPLSKLSSKTIRSYKTYYNKMIGCYASKTYSLIKEKYGGKYKKNKSFNREIEKPLNNNKIRLNKCTPLIDGIFNVDYLRMISESNWNKNYPQREQMKNVVYLMDILELINS